MKINTILFRSFREAAQRPLKLALLAFLSIACFAVFLNGCCNTHFKVKQLGDDIHTYFLDGDPEDLSEAEPDSAI